MSEIRNRALAEDRTFSFPDSVNRGEYDVVRVLAYLLDGPDGFDRLDNVADRLPPGHEEDLDRLVDAAVALVRHRRSERTRVEVQKERTEPCPNKPKGVADVTGPMKRMASGRYVPDEAFPGFEDLRTGTSDDPRSDDPRSGTNLQDRLVAKGLEALDRIIHTERLE